VNDLFISFNKTFIKENPIHFEHQAIKQVPEMPTYLLLVLTLRSVPPVRKGQEHRDAAVSQLDGLHLVGYKP
jgi:hypothetical protein